MRTILWTVFLVVALQGMASASVFASPTDLKSSPQMLSRSMSEIATARLDTLRVQPPLSAESERKAVPTQRQLLSKNFSSPKPVQIYWFFGGR